MRQDGQYMVDEILLQPPVLVLAPNTKLWGAVARATPIRIRDGAIEAVTQPHSPQVEFSGRTTSSGVTTELAEPGDLARRGLPGPTADDSTGDRYKRIPYPRLVLSGTECRHRFSISSNEYVLFPLFTKSCFIFFAAR